MFILGKTVNLTIMQCLLGLLCTGEGNDLPGLMSGMAMLLEDMSVMLSLLFCAGEVRGLRGWKSGMA